MVNMLQAGSQWLVAQNRASMSSPVTISRPSTGQSTANIPAKLGKTPFQITNHDGVITMYESHDFQICTPDYAFGGVACEPVFGDRVTDENGSVWEVGIDGNNQCFSRIEFEQAYRIHTKKTN